MENKQTINNNSQVGTERTLLRNYMIIWVQYSDTTGGNEWTQGSIFLVKSFIVNGSYKIM